MADNNDAQTSSTHSTASGEEISQNLSGPKPLVEDANCVGSERMGSELSIGRGRV